METACPKEMPVSPNWPAGFLFQEGMCWYCVCDCHIMWYTPLKKKGALGSFSPSPPFDSAKPRLPEAWFGVGTSALNASAKMWVLSKRAAVDVEASCGRYGEPRTPSIEQPSKRLLGFELRDVRTRAVGP